MDSTLFEDFYFMDIFSDEEDVNEQDKAKEKSFELSEFEIQEVVIDCNPELTKLAHLSGLENLEYLEKVLEANKEKSFDLTSLTSYLNTLDLENIEFEIDEQQSIFKTQFLDEIEFVDCTSTPAKSFSKVRTHQENKADDFHQPNVNEKHESLFESEASKNSKGESLAYEVEDDQIGDLCVAVINHSSISITEPSILENKESEKSAFETNHNIDDLSNKIETQITQEASKVIDQQLDSCTGTYVLDSTKDQELNFVPDVESLVYTVAFEENECSRLLESKKQEDNARTECQNKVHEECQQAEKSFEKKALETPQLECQKSQFKEEQEEKAQGVFESEIALLTQERLLVAEVEQSEAKLETSLAVEDTLSKSEVLETQVDINFQLLQDETSKAPEKVDTVSEAAEKVECNAQISKSKVNLINDLHDSFLETQVFEAVEALTMAMEGKPEEEENKKRADQLLDNVENAQEFLQLSSVHDATEFEEIDLNSVHSQYTPYKSKSFEYNDTIDLLAEDLACLKLGNNTFTMMTIKDELSEIVEQEEEDEANDSFASAKSDLKDEPELEKSEVVSYMEVDDYESLPSLSPIKKILVDHHEEQIETEVQPIPFVTSLKEPTDSDFILPTPIKAESMVEEEKGKNKLEAEVKAVLPVESTHDTVCAPSLQSIDKKESFAELQASFQFDGKLDDDFLANDDLNRLSLNFKSKIVANSTIGNLEEDTLQILDLAKLDSELAPIDCLNCTSVSRPSGEKELSSTKYESSSSLSNELEVAFIRSKLDMTLGSIREDTFAEMDELRLSKIENHFENTTSRSLNSSSVQSHLERNKSVNLIDFSISNANQSLNQNARKNISTPKSCLKSELTFFNKSDLKTEKSRKSKMVTFISPDVSQTTRKSSFQKIVRTPIVKPITDEKVRPARTSRTSILEPIIDENVQSPQNIGTPIFTPITDENIRPARFSKTPVTKPMTDENVRPARDSKTSELLESSQKELNVTRSPLIKLDLQNSPLNTSLSRSTISKPKNFVSKLPTLVSRKPATTMTTKSPKTSTGFAMPTTISKIKPPGEFAKPSSVLKSGSFKIPTVKPHKDTPRAKPGQPLTNRFSMSTVYTRPLF